MRSSLRATTPSRSSRPDDRTHPDCPYCGRTLQWAQGGWLARGWFECERCGDFPVFHGLGGPAARAIDVWNASPSYAPPKTPSRPRVLLVDDSQEHLDLYALMLEDMATVLTASRGEDALVVAGAESPVAIILDVMMPGMDGWRVCECLKRNP